MNAPCGGPPTPDDPAQAENPFCSRRVRPGALPYRFPASLDAAALVRRLAALGGRAEIVGPHGSGKSALLAALAPALQQAGKQTVLVELHDGQRQLPPDCPAADGLPADAVLLVDGCEQLAWWNWRRLRRQVERCGCGLLVTTHASRGLPRLLRTAPTLELARQIAADLQAGGAALVAADDVQAAFDRHGGDLREMLFDLYDRYEERRRAAASP